MKGFVIIFLSAFVLTFLIGLGFLQILHDFPDAPEIAVIFLGCLAFVGFVYFIIKRLRKS